MKHLEVTTRYGRIRGRKETSIEVFDYYAFRGIPYAKPPIGHLRFQESIPPEAWSGTKDAFEFGSMCAQHDIITNVAGGSEDCLYLNVYVKKIESNVRHPVMVWIHGGGFSFGSGSNLLYGPDYLMEKDVVLVTINYRLGVLGFLDLQDEIVPGNQGLKDQVMALHWVRDNIGNFGGDSENVTIFGQSAGGAAVHYLTMSPLARGLINKAISQSGTALCPWASVKGDAKLKAYALCQLLNIKTKDHKEIVQYLQDVDVMDLIDAQRKLTLIEKNLTVFVPGWDKMSPNPFLSLPLNEAAQEGVHVPYLLGNTNREGAFFYKLLEKLSDFISKDLHLEKQFHPNVSGILNEYNLTINDLKELYSCDNSSEQNNVEKLIDMHGDINFVHGVQKVIRIQMEHRLSPTYMYKFAYDKGYGFTKSMFDFQMTGASHMDDLFYLFSMRLLGELGLKPLIRGSANHRVMRQMVEMWTNFAKFGKPTPSVSKIVPKYWHPVEDKRFFCYMNIGKTLEMKTTQNIEDLFLNKK